MTGTNDDKFAQLEAGLRTQANGMSLLAERRRHYTTLAWTLSTLAHLIAITLIANIPLPIVTPAVFMIALISLPVFDHIIKIERALTAALGNADGPGRADMTFGHKHGTWRFERVKSFEDCRRCRSTTELRKDRRDGVAALVVSLALTGIMSAALLTSLEPITLATFIFFLMSVVMCIGTARDGFDLLGTMLELRRRQRVDTAPSSDTNVPADAAQKPEDTH